MVSRFSSLDELLLLADFVDDFDEFESESSEWSDDWGFLTFSTGFKSAKSCDLGKQVGQRKYLSRSLISMGRLLCLSLKESSVSIMCRMHLMWNEWLNSEFLHSNSADSSYLTLSPTTTTDDLNIDLPLIDILQSPQYNDCSWNATP